MGRVYGNDHLPAHFHVITPDAEALVVIATLTILRGALRASVWAEVQDWAVANREALATEWNRCNPSRREASDGHD
jgi:hypothetical protein